MGKAFDLSYWINEREAMRQRRDQLILPPWSADPYMANVRYCNVHREDDKVTKYLRNDSSWSRPTIPTWVVVLSRMVNRIETLASLKAEVNRGDLAGIKEVLKARRVLGPIWGNAYTISTCGKSMDKVDYVVDWVVQACMEAQEPEFGSLQEAWEQLTSIDGLGSFLAAQVVADLKNIRHHPLATAQDWHTWCAHGPGSLKGLSAYFGRTITPASFQSAIKECYDETMPLVADYVGTIHMQDFQNCLCEFSKYERVRAGGHARNRYDARNPS